MHTTTQASALQLRVSGAVRSVELELFYSDVLTDKLDFKSEYQVWKKRIQSDPSEHVQAAAKQMRLTTAAHASASDKDGISPLEFGFLFGPACKAREHRLYADVNSYLLRRLLV
jgi:hypothetical protein